MIYFDNKFLMRYLGTKRDLKVYVNQEYIIIASIDDILNPESGFGYTVYGEPRTFDYRDIENVMSGNTIFTMDDLQKYGNKYKVGETEEERDEEMPEEEDEGDEGDEGGDEDFGAEDEGGEDEGGDEGDEGEEPVFDGRIRKSAFVECINPLSPNFKRRGAIVEISKTGYITFETWDSAQGKLTEITEKRSNIRPVDLSRKF